MVDLEADEHPLGIQDRQRETGRYEALDEPGLRWRGEIQMIGLDQVVDQDPGSQFRFSQHQSAIAGRDRRPRRRHLHDATTQQREQLIAPSRLMADHISVHERGECPEDPVRLWKYVVLEVDQRFDEDPRLEEDFESVLETRSGDAEAALVNVLTKESDGQVSRSGYPVAEHGTDEIEQGPWMFGDRKNEQISALLRLAPRRQTIGGSWRGARAPGREQTLSRDVVSFPPVSGERPRP